MPIEYKVTLYGCSFKCGHRHRRKKKYMEAHEQRCWWNPVNRTCKTCVNEVYYSDSAGDIYGDGRTWYVRECKGGLGEGLIDDIYDQLAVQHPNNGSLYHVQIPPVLDCPFWESGCGAEDNSRRSS